MCGAASIAKAIAAICHPDVFQPITMLVYHNDGNGHFTEVAHKLGLDKPAKALGIAIADYDRDGRIDIFVANDSMPEFLFHQKNDGTFEEVGLETGAAVNAEGQTYAGMGVDFADYDNDGWPDIVVDDLANQRYALYQNNRRRHFQLRFRRRAASAPCRCFTPAGACAFSTTITTAGRTCWSRRGTIWIPSNASIRSSTIASR